MATQFLGNKSATTEIVNKPGSTGIGIVSDKPYINPAGTVLALAHGKDNSSLKIARGQHTTVAASDTVVTGLSSVVAVVATLDSDPGDDPMLVTASIGDQAGTPAAGSILIKTWKNTGGTDPTPLAATTFSKKVNWIAIGA